MYKLIVVNVVVDIVKKLRYVRYIPELNKVVITTAASAHGVCGSDNKTFYALPQVAVPQEKSYWKTVTLIKINETEYHHLEASLKKYDKVPSSSYIAHLRSRKIKEMSTCCNEAIIAGFSCVLSDGAAHHFRLTIEDQLNLIDIERQILQGCSAVLFHSTDNVCTLFSAEDLSVILTAATNHKQYHTTYFNLLKHCINSIEDADVIEGIHYGIDLLALPISMNIKQTVRNCL